MQERGGTPRIPSVPPSPCRSIPMASNNNITSSPIRKLSSGLPGPKVSASRFGAPPQNNNPAQNNRSFLDKFKPVRTTQSGIAESPSHLPTMTSQPAYDDLPRGLGKRTSSSSGFSSARSISSKSSGASLSSDTNFHSPSAMRRIQENVTLQQQQQQQPNNNNNKIPTPQQQQQQQQQHRSPKQQPRGNNPNAGRKLTKIPNGNGSIPSAATSGRSPCSSPKRSPKLLRAAAGATELKDYGLIDQRVSTNVNYPPHAFPSQGAGKTKLEYSPSQLQQQQQQQLQMQSKIPNPNSRIATSGLQKPGQVGTKLSQTGIPSNTKEQLPRSGEVPGNEEIQGSPMMQSRACSLPRQKRDEMGPTNVAVVSPMPNSASTSKIELGSNSCQPQKTNSVDEGDTLKNPVPLAMVPLGMCSKSGDSSKMPQHFMPFSSHVPSATTMAALISSGRTTKLFFIAYCNP